MGAVHEPRQPGVLTRVRAAWRGEQSAVVLEAMRRAGKAAYGELLRTDQLRADAAADGALWGSPTSAGSQLLAGWNAFVLQTLSEAFLDADYDTAPGTVGFVPPATFQQVWAWLSATQGWLSRLEQARRNPDYNVTAELALPAWLPGWGQVTRWPPAHVAAMVAAIPAIRANADLALFALDNQVVPADQVKSLHRLQEYAARAAAAADYALALHRDTHDDQVRELVGQNLRYALELWFDLGQLAAVPKLIAGYRDRTPPVRPELAALPGGIGFDPWCLTDRDARKQWKDDPAAARAIQALWAKDPDPSATMALHAEIEAALKRRDLARISTGAGSYYFSCPWSSLYEVRRPLRLCGQDLEVLRQFTIDISVRGAQFRRQLVFGPFEQTDDIGYFEQPKPPNPSNPAPGRNRQRRRR